MEKKEKISGHIIWRVSAVSNALIRLQFRTTSEKTRSFKRKNINYNQIVERIANLEKTWAAIGLSEKQSQNLAILQQQLKRVRARLKLIPESSGDGLVFQLPGEKDT